MHSQCLILQTAVKSGFIHLKFLTWTRSGKACDIRAREHSRATLVRIMLLEETLCLGIFSFEVDKLDNNLNKIIQYYNIIKSNLKQSNFQ